MYQSGKKTKSGRVVRPPLKTHGGDFDTATKRTKKSSVQDKQLRSAEAEWQFDEDSLLFMNDQEEVIAAGGEILPGYDTLLNNVTMASMDGNVAAPAHSRDMWVDALKSVKDAMDNHVKALGERLDAAKTADMAEKIKTQIMGLKKEIADDVATCRPLVAEADLKDFEYQVSLIHYQLATYVIRASRVVKDKRINDLDNPPTTDPAAASGADAGTVVADADSQHEEGLQLNDDAQPDSVEKVIEELDGIVDQLKKADKLRRTLMVGTGAYKDQETLMESANKRRKELENTVQCMSADDRRKFDMQKVVLMSKEIDNLMDFLNPDHQRRRPQANNNAPPARTNFRDPPPPDDNNFDKRTYNLGMPTVTLSSELYEKKIQEEQSYLAQDTIIDQVRRRAQADIDWNDLYEGRNLSQFYDPGMAREIVRDDVKPMYFNGTGEVTYRDFKEYIHAGIVMKRNMNWFEKCIKLKNLCTGPVKIKIARCSLSKDGFIEALQKLDSDYLAHRDEAEEVIHDLLIKMRERPPISVRDLNSVEAALVIIEEIVDCNGRAGKDPTEGEASILSNIRMDSITARDYRDFKEKKLQSRNSLRLFITWAKVRIRDQLRAKRTDALLKNLTKTFDDMEVKEDDHRPWKRNDKYRAKYRQIKEATGFVDDDSDEYSSSDESEIVALAKEKQQCLVCQQFGHRGFECTNWSKQNLREVVQRMENAKLCKRCLQGRHTMDKCKSTEKCDKCGSMEHHSKLHHAQSKKVTSLATTTQPQNDLKKQLTDCLMNAVRLLSEDATLLTQDLGCPGDESGEEENIEIVGFASDVSRSWMTVPVEIATGADFARSVETNALLDTGSSVTLLQPHIAKVMGAKGKRKSMAVQVVGNNQVVKQPSFKGTMYIRARGTQEPIFQLKFSTFNLPIAIQPVDPNRIKSKYEELKMIEFPTPVEGDLGLLIGFDNMQLMTSEKDTYVKGGPLARKTPLGWSMLFHPKTGGVEATAFVSDWKQFNQCQAVCDTEMRYLLDRQYGLESIGIDRAEQPSTRLTLAEEIALAKMKETLRRLPNGLYEVGIPFKGDTPQLPDNFKQCSAIQKKLDKKHEQDPNVAKAVVDTMAEYERLGIIEPVPASEVGTGYFLPVFCVPKEGSETTKYRFVYNAKQNFEGTSINEQMYTGPNYLDDIYDTMVQFRVGEVAVVGDIEKMYLMISLPEKDRKYVRIVVNGRQMQFCRWPFGLRAAPSVANFVVKHHIKQHGSQLLQKKAKIYMDDFIVAFETLEEAKEVVEEIVPLMSSCGMELRKFVSNKPEVLQGLDKKRLGKAMVVGTSLEPVVHSTLGLKWEPTTDHIGYALSKVEQRGVTKRIMSSQIASVYDPLGALTPCLLKARKALQLAHKADKDKKLSWDDELTKSDHPLVLESVKLWKQWQEEFEEMTIVRYPRMVAPRIDENTILHMCSDGSDLAFATTAHIASANGSHKPGWLTTKARIQGVKQRTIPEVELAGALLSARLSNRLINLLFMGREAVWYWVDNTSVICWIRKAGVDRSVYVRNRAIEISDTTIVERWNHIPTDQNSSDVATRGCSGSQLAQHNTYWSGPEYFAEDMTNWKLMKLKVTEEELAGTGQISLMSKDLGCPCQVEINQLGMIQDHVVKLGDQWRLQESQEIFVQMKQVLHSRNVGRWSIMVRAITRALLAWQGEKTEDELPLDKMADVARRVLILGQWLKMEKDIRKFLATNKWPQTTEKHLALAVGDDGLIRVHSRLYNQEYVAQSQQYPILMVDSWPFVLYMWTLHFTTNHVRNDDLWYKAIRVFAGAAVKKISRRVSSECVQCRKLHSPMSKQLMGSIPNLQLNDIRPCSKIAIDFTGIQYVKFFRKRIPAYILVAVCLQTKVVTLEVTIGQNTEAVIMALSRIAARRGPIEECFSDNGGSFIKVKRLLTKEEKKQMAMGPQNLNHSVDKINWKKVQMETVRFIRKWNMNAPRDHEANGQVEAFVRLAKRAVKDHIDQGEVDLEIFRTWVSMAENVVNSRPIAIVEQSDGEKVILTPNHLIVGRLGDTGVFSRDGELSHDLHMLAGRLDSFEKTWTNYYLATMQERGKFLSMTDNIQENDTVVVAEEDLKIKRGKWTIGRVIRAIKSKDGLVRKVVVKHRHGIIERGIRQLIPLPTLPFIKLD